mmetsp:Transcript_159850/g.298063  ORF Transcript_159850/g.298063 Transcript_159850/m.298063 type:complete len:507 (-) Transcript_159850:86-1606(-)
MSAPAAGGRIVTGESYIGEILSKRPECGFIKSPLVTANHGADVFAPAAVLAKWQIGDVVCFDLMLNAKGQPQATNIRDVLDMEPRGGVGRKIATAFPTGRAFNGVLSRMSDNNAFIRCEPVHQYYGLDVFCTAAVLRDVQVGTLVNFELVINEKEQPQAVNVMVVSHENTGSHGGAGNAVRANVKYTTDGMLDTGESYVGILQTVQGDTAAIACEQTMAVFGVDVSCPAPDLNVFNISEPVVFDLVLDGDAQPLARNLRRVLNMEARGGNGRGTALARPVGKSYNGVINQMTDTHAFIKNQTVSDQTGGFDIFCAPAVLVGLELGTEVNLELVVNHKMQPQAEVVRTIGPIEDPGMSGIFGASPGDLGTPMTQASGLGNPSQPTPSWMKGQGKGDQKGDKSHMASDTVPSKGADGPPSSDMSAGKGQLQPQTQQQPQQQQPQQQPQQQHQLQQQPQHQQQQQQELLQCQRQLQQCQQQLQHCQQQLQQYQRQEQQQLQQTWVTRVQ